MSSKIVDVCEKVLKRESYDSESRSGSSLNALSENVSTEACSITPKLPRRIGLRALEPDTRDRRASHKLELEVNEQKPYTSRGV
jgi:hypothetical protein